jgi:hypothetical protein
MLLLVYARKRLAPHLGAPMTASAACGIMGAFFYVLCLRCDVCACGVGVLTALLCARQAWAATRAAWACA